jgi:hypothetical protein
VLPSGSQSVDLNRTYIGLTRHSVQLVLSEDHERKMVRSAGGKPLDANASLPDQRPSGSTRFATRTDPRGSNTDVRTYRPTAYNGCQMTRRRVRTDGIAFGPSYGNSRS